MRVFRCLDKLALNSDHVLTEAGHKMCRFRRTSDSRSQTRIGKSGTSATELKLKKIHNRDAKQARMSARAKVRHQTDLTQGGDHIPNDAEAPEICGNSCRKVCSKAAGAPDVLEFGGEDRIPESMINALSIVSSVATVGTYGTAEQIRFRPK